ncbi:hypothetical protein MNBD_BACTEROID01-1131 [hydrothermal vent metagenome]|uniref:Uncharacterized protein n=1 Tax=hydrothermal vent metagenome TaxID=652676 RepID=A0A3B0TS55_9ZZZZ
MQKGIKNTSTFFLWLAGLIIFSHAITPHHHHFSPIVNYSHQVNHKDNPPEDNPFHCHSFNNLAIDKVEVISNKSSSIKIISDIAIINSTCFQYSKNPRKRICFSTNNDCLLNIVFLKNSPTRGSPAIA